MTRSEITHQLKVRALEMGFERVGIARATPGLAMEHLSAWLERGWHGEMSYMDRHASARANPDSILSGVRAVIMTALVYQPDEQSRNRELENAGEAKVSRYAWGADYHDVMKQKLQCLAEKLLELMPDARCRRVVDSAPLMERDYARIAGIGWIGKHTLLLNREIGSWFFLGGLLVDQELDYDEPFESDHCGSCTRCLDACPTHAFRGPYELDARKCISYLTIEHRSEIDVTLRPMMEDWIFGCDVCQDVCPWNRRAPQSQCGEFSAKPAQQTPSLGQLLEMDDETFRQAFRGTAILRTGRVGIVRNALIVAVNQNRTDLVGKIAQLEADPAEIVRSTAIWARNCLDDRLSKPENLGCP